MQIRIHDAPTEEWMEWRALRIHLDRMSAPDAKLKIIFIHGAGGNGRLLAPYARLLQQGGYEVVAPDLPPYGLSNIASMKRVDYQLWIDILVQLIDRELARDGKPIVLLGSSIGGMLAYHVAVQSRKARGLIATTFVDTSQPDVRDQLAPNKIISRAGKFAMDKLSLLLDSWMIPVTAVSRMNLITNNAEMTRLIEQDPHAAGTRVTIRLLRTFLNRKPALPPESFDLCPVLLVHPELDPMTPLHFSQPFFDRIPARKECVILEGAGHFPIELQGLQQMKWAVLRFLKSVE